MSSRVAKRSSQAEISLSGSRQGMSRSPIRTRSSLSPARSPSRRSPARSPSRRSPARKSVSRPAKLPVRKSPTRSTKDADEKSSPKSATKRPPLQQSQVSQDLSDIEVYRSLRTRRSEYSMKYSSFGLRNEESEFSSINQLNDINNQMFNDVNVIRKNREAVLELTPLRSSQSQDRQIEESNSERNSIDDSADKTRISHSGEHFEEYKKEKSLSVTRILGTPVRENLFFASGKWEFGGRFGTSLLIFGIPLIVFTILASCEKDCAIKSLFNIYSYNELSLWFNMQSFFLIGAQYAIQMFGILLIFSTKNDKMDTSDKKYFFSASFACIISVFALFILSAYGVLNHGLLLNEYLKLAVTSYYFSLIISVILFMKSGHIKDKTELNPYGSSGYVLYDFFMGREIHPHLKNINVKIWISRISNINTVVLLILIIKQGIQLELNELMHLYAKHNVAIFNIENLKEVLSMIHLQPTIIIYSLMQLTYILYFIVKECEITTTFYWQSEGIGYLQLVSSALYPFYFTSISKYVADSSLSMSTGILVFASVLYAVGFFMMYSSNKIKYEFRKNPNQSNLSHLVTMPTIQGKKLLISGLWGKLRHPNYAGDILIHIALALPGMLTQHFIAAAPAFLTLLVLLHRAWRDHARCERRYGAAWQRYCNRVPAIIIPKVL